jgi:cytochrome c biogenesis protein CcmG, thiol:disulfide interchange protein DsbE
VTAPRHTGKLRHPARWVALGVAIVVAAFGIVLATQVSTDPTAAATKSELVGKPAPDYSLTTFDGREVSASSLSGKAVIVNFWNSWCTPCQRELPELKAFYAQHAGEADFAMVGIVRDDTREAAQGYAISEGMRWLLTPDPSGDAALAFGTRGQPETYAISPDGVVAGALIGPATTHSLDTMLAAARGQA